MGDVEPTLFLAAPNDLDESGGVLSCGLEERRRKLRCLQGRQLCERRLLQPCETDEVPRRDRELPFFSGFPYPIQLLLLDEIRGIKEGPIMKLPSAVASSSGATSFPASISSTTTSTTTS